MEQNVMTIRIIVEGSEVAHQEYERTVRMSIPIEQGILRSAISIDPDLIADKLNQEIAAKLREVADEIEGK